MLSTIGKTAPLVAVVHSSSLLRSALTSILSDIDHLEVDSAAKLDDIVANIRGDRIPDTVLFSVEDFSSQFQSLSDFKTTHPGIKVLTLSHKYRLEELFSLFDIDVDGVLLDDVSRNTIELALRMIAEDQKVYPSNMATVIKERIQLASAMPCEQVIGTLEDIDLSQREREILGCLEKGASNKQIANRLDISEATVKVHVKSILRKIKVDNRTQAAIWALHNQSSGGHSSGSMLSLTT
jgi:two-component system nitrate/nitrite response regulator NarL